MQTDFSGPTHFDFILAGGGLAGLSLAYQLALSPLRDKTVLIIDREAKNQNDRTWCFWTRQPTLFDGIAYRQWQQLRFVGEGYENVFRLPPYRYQLVRGIDFYRFAREQLARHANVYSLRGAVERVEDGETSAAVTAAGRTYRGEWVFNSLFSPGEFKPDPRYLYLKQHFRGWEIETERDCFDPATPLLFDFRVPQNGAVRFFYILPFSARQALVEYTLFSTNLLVPEEYAAALRVYLAETLGIKEYRVVSEENGVIPMTLQPLARRAGWRILNIGTRGGRVKPSTGYAFLRIQKDTTAIVQSLLETGHPFDTPPEPARYRWYDAVLLRLMADRGELIKPIFTALFRRNPLGRIFRFLDETGSLSENLKLITSLPPGPFLLAAAKVLVKREG